MLAAGNDDRPIGFVPRYLSHGSELYQSLVRNETMTSFGLDLSKSPAEMLGEDFAMGLVFSALVVLLGMLYWVQQRMVASRAAVSPTMSPAQQKLMQYLPVAFAAFQVFFLLGLVVYYIVQTVLRIAQQYYITKRFYSGDESLGRQAQAASAHARELAKADGGGGPLAQAKRDMTDARKGAKGKQASRARPGRRRRNAPRRPRTARRRHPNRRRTVPVGRVRRSKKRNG